ncbi:type III pantothenate kinase [Williamsoniiplasma somnilux]|uniref:Type III pantothenate kinase n=1 Tax=Williamsoniiplasma somnilux TaxID=215578 RepID=A0A2K8NYM4_9MOLU|nr:type III pantothenate kinase [Williamsoniiplasma somnilux]ATZ18925.1 type III pantothenate kinase [Williamsoniiplasma somnilux]
MGKILLTDIGNTSIHFKLYDEQKNIYLTENRFYINEKIKFSSFINKGIVDEIVYSSVVPKLSKKLINFANKKGIKIRSIKDFKSINYKKFNIENTNELGADFVAYFHAMNNKKNHIIISLGTATTLSVICNKKFEGAIIMPGIKTSLYSLINKAALLKTSNFHFSNQIIGKNTAEAINIGSINSHYYAIEKNIELIKQNMKIDEVIFTGGNAYLLNEKIKEKYILDEDLIFKGIINIYNK